MNSHDIEDRFRFKNAEVEYKPKKTFQVNIRKNFLTITRNKILYEVVSSTAKGFQNYILEAIHISDREGHVYIM